MSATAYCRIARFEDPDDHARQLPGVDQQYRQIGPGRFAGTLGQFDCGEGVFVYREQMNVPLLQEGRILAGSRTLGIALDVDRVSTFQGQPTGDAIANLSGGQGFESHNRGVSDYAGVAMRDDVFAEYAEYLGGERALDWTRFALVPVGGMALRRTARQLRECLEAAGSNPDALRHANARKMLREEVMGQVLCMLVDAEAPRRTDITRLTYADVVNRSREHVMANREEAVSVLDLCRLLRISRRTLQTSFLAVSGVAPTTYLRAVRLAAVRRLLRETPAAELGIADAAAHWGFLHASKFTADFRRMFGHAPSQVVRP